MSTAPKKKRGRFQDFVGDRAITTHHNKQGGYDVIAHRDPTHIKRVSNAGAMMGELYREAKARDPSLKMADFMKTKPLDGKKVGSRDYTIDEYYAKDSHRHPKIRQLSNKPKLTQLTPPTMPKLKPKKSTVGMIGKGHITQLLGESGYKPERYSDKGKPIYSKIDRSYARKHILDNYDYYYYPQQ